MAIQDIRFPQRSSSLSALSKTETVDKVLTTPKRSHSILRNSSLPSKPDLSKTALTKKRSISFSRDIEHICLFKRFESPRTIATNEQYSLKDHGDLEAASISGAIDSIESSWKILGTNRPPPFRLSDMGALTLEDVYFATDSLYRHRSSRSSGRSLVVDILVRNIAFQKYVGVRYSRDNWVTWNEMPASFVGSVSPSHQFHEGLDRLRFQIQLDEEFENTGNQKDATFQFALKYQVSGRDHWDSNSKRNYQVSTVCGLIVPKTYHLLNRFNCKKGLNRKESWILTPLKMTWKCSCMAPNWTCFSRNPLATDRHTDAAYLSHHRNLQL